MAIGALLTYVYGQLKIRWKRYRQRNVRKSFLDDLDERLNIHTIAYGAPVIAKVRVEQTDEEFILPYGEFQDADLEFLSQYINVADLLERLELGKALWVETVREAKNQITYEFKHGLNGRYFNGPKSGILSCQAHLRDVDNQEAPMVRLRLYRTDYFTQNVMMTIIQNLTSQSPGSQLKPEELFYFRNSLGVNVFLILPATNELVIAKRSQDAAFMDSGRTLVASAVEGLTPEDGSSQINLTSGVLRGLEEELGLTVHDLDTSSLKNYAMFFGKEYFQDGFIFSIEANENITKEDLGNRLGRDRRLEIEDLLFIPNTKGEIRKFILDHEEDLQFQAIYGLELYSKMNFG